MQNVLLERTQRELWNLYAWPHLDYHVDFDLAANTQLSTSTRRCRSKTSLSLWRNYEPNNQQPWIQLRYGFEDSINETLASYPPIRWRNVVTCRPDERADAVQRPGANLADPDPAFAHALARASAA